MLFKPKMVLRALAAALILCCSGCALGKKMPLASFISRPDTAAAQQTVADDSGRSGPHCRSGFS